ncbi:MAG: hypothetical protein QG599_463 [Pseudomonadota bacterium]|nr:hypothetical protein [Pseudomonadota bacterium]
MPQLPSGRQVAILCQNILKMAELNAQNVQRYPIHRVKTVADLWPLVDVLFFRTDPDYQPGANTYHEGCQHLEELARKEPYLSGFTLATLDDEAQTWSPEDRQAFVAFLQESRTQAHLQEVLETVLDSQRRKPPAHIPSGLFGQLSGDEVMDMFWELSQRPSSLETPLTSRPEGIDSDEYDLLAALCRMNGLQEFEEWQTRFGPILEGLEAFLQRLRDDHRLLSVWLQYWVVPVEEMAGRMRGDHILTLLAPETLAGFATQAAQEALALQPLFTEPEIARHFAPERAILEKAALSMTSAGLA